MQREFLKNSVIVAAHPDDEVLWFGSLVPHVEQLILVFQDFWAHPDLGFRRMDTVRTYPRKGVLSLNISESGIHGCADAAFYEHGEIRAPDGREVELRELKQKVKRALGRAGFGNRFPAPVTSIREIYEANSVLIAHRLRLHLRQGMNVFTHNPWGEYGHEEHVQLYRTLSMLRSEIGFNLWISNHCESSLEPLAHRMLAHIPEQYITLPVDGRYAERIAAHYKEHDCWTWAPHWRWPDEESFFLAPRIGPLPPSAPARLPLNLFEMGQRNRKQRIA